MAYDSETYGQSPFGNATKKVSPDTKDTPQSESGSAPGPALSDGLADDGLDIGPSELPSALNSSPAPVSPPTKASRSKPKSNASKRHSSRHSSEPRSAKSRSKKDTSAAEAAALAKAFQPDSIPPAVGRIAEKLGLGKTLDKLTHGLSEEMTTGPSKRKSRTTAKPTSQKSSRKSGSKRKKTKAEEAAQAEAEAAVARRFQEEDRAAYLSLLYKLGISMLVWAVLRLSRHELSKNTIAIINLIIHPLIVAAVTIVAAVGLTFWLRRLLNDLARHTQQLRSDAEVTGGKNYRPTLEIVGDSLEYNPQLRKNFSRLFDAASVLVCTLVSYLITSALLP